MPGDAFSGVIGSPLRDDLAGLTDTSRVTYGLQAGHTYGISLSGLYVDVRLEISDPSGVVVGRADNTPPGDDLIVFYTPQEDGDFDFLVSAASVDAEVADFSLLVQDQGGLPSLDRRREPIYDDITGLRDEGLQRRVLRDLSDDQRLDKVEIERILKSVVRDDGVVSGVELKDLRLLSGSLAEYLDPASSGYIQYIYDSVVLGSPANKFWTGGKLQQERLGDLKAGSDRAHLNRLIDKWFLGLDLPMPIVPGDQARNPPEDNIKDAPYVKAGGKLFSRNISYADINQGVLADCWLLASAASLAAWKPAEIRSMFVDNQDGTYGVRFYELSTKRFDSADAAAHWVTVDRQLLANPADTSKLLNVAGSPQKSFGDELWPALLEKGAAQASELGIFQAARPMMAINSFESLNLGIDYGIAMLAPASLRTLGAMSISEIPKDDSLPYLPPMPLGRYSLATTKDEFVAFVRDQAGDGGLIGGTIVSMDETEYSRYYPRKTFAGGHVFGIVGFEGGELELYNPWGILPGNPSPHYLSPFKISPSDLYDIFIEPKIGLRPNAVSFAR